jgi:hypothetical protein
MRRAEELLEESGLALHRKAEEQTQPAQRRDARWR